MKAGTVRAVKQSIVTLDLEGVLVPEIWIAVSEKTGLKELRLTTRDIPDYDVLMKGRLNILDRQNLGLSDIQEVIGTLRPLDVRDNHHLGKAFNQACMRSGHVSSPPEVGGVVPT